MLLSMTGFGEARVQTRQALIGVEIRSVNNRHFKLQFRASDPYLAMEAECERLLRTRIHRGSVVLSIRRDPLARTEHHRINPDVIRGYLDQLRNALEGVPDDRVAPIDPTGLLRLPGVLEDQEPDPEPARDDWPRVLEAIGEALEAFLAERAREGESMASTLRNLTTRLREGSAGIARCKDRVLDEYRGKLLQRVQRWLSEHDVEVQPADLVREIALFADRSDITEELTRLAGHLDQLEAMLRPSAESNPSGRQLEFLVQEIGREVNTIGSKANDLSISQNVIQLKGDLEKIRELIQNVE